MASSKPHEKVGRVIQVLGIMHVPGSAGFLIFLSFSKWPERSPLVGSAEIIGLSVMMLAFAIFIIYVGSAVRKHKEWARIISMLYATLLLLGVPVGTIIGAYILWNLTIKWKLPLVEVPEGSGIPPQRRIPRDPEDAKRIKQEAKKASAMAKKTMTTEKKKKGVTAGPSRTRKRRRAG